MGRNLNTFKQWEGIWKKITFHVVIFILIVNWNFLQLYFWVTVDYSFVKIPSSCQNSFQLSKFLPVVKIPYSCQNVLQLSKFLTVVKISYSCQNVLQLSKFLTVFKIPSSCKNFLQLSKFHPVVKISYSCQNLLQLSKFFWKGANFMRIHGNSILKNYISLDIYFLNFTF